MTRERFEELTIIALHRSLTQAEVFELFLTILEARPDLSGEDA